MGSFNLACSISGISIGGGTKAVYIPLDVARHPNKIGSGNHSLLGLDCFYVPLALPVFGEYDSYGRLENIEKNRNTAILEQYFKTGIEQIADISNQPEEIKSGMFVHRQIFDLLVAGLPDEFGEKSEADDRTKLAAQLADYRKQIAERTSDHNKMLTALKSAAEAEKDPEKLAELQVLLETWETRNPLDYNNGNMFRFRDYELFNSIYQSTIAAGELEEELINMVIFEAGMYSVNRFYFPAMNGHQYGNDYASRELFKKSLEIVSLEIKEREDEDAEEDEK